MEYNERLKKYFMYIENQDDLGYLGEHFEFDSRCDDGLSNWRETIEED